MFGFEIIYIRQSQYARKSLKNVLIYGLVSSIESSPLVDCMESKIN